MAILSGRFLNGKTKQKHTKKEKDSFMLFFLDLFHHLVVVNVLLHIGTALTRCPLISAGTAVDKWESW